MVWFLSEKVFGWGIIKKIKVIPPPPIKVIYNFLYLRKIYKLLAHLFRRKIRAIVVVVMVLQKL